MEINVRLTPIKNLILDILFPPLCAACGAYAETFLCAACLTTIHRNTALICPVCGGRLADIKTLCHPKTLFLLGAAGAYNDPVLLKTIHAFKYGRVRSLAQPLSALLISYLESVIKNSDFDIRNSIIVPIPLHTRRLRERGFNQALLLSKPLAAFYNLPVCEALARVKNNKPQMEITGREARYQNIAGVFRVNDAGSIAGKNILLVDDVFTSGATMTEAVEVLKENGARRIIALVLARA